ncbi:MAG: M3 family oligoendopeptidase [Chloroflexi bacterium]|nr:M3 family oligoendopeptidase [Chloroflexota bacterium]
MSDKTAEAAVKATGAENTTWDLTDLYAAVDDPQIDADLAEAMAQAEKLVAAYKGHIADLDAVDVYKMLEHYELLSELVIKPQVYAYLGWSTQTDDPKWGALLQRTREHATRVHQQVLFVELEWAEVDDAVADRLLDDPALSHYRHWLEVERLNRPYMLAEAEERLLSEKATTGIQAWRRYFTQVVSSIKHDWDGQPVPLQVLTSRLYDNDRAVRQRAAEGLTTELKVLLPTTTYIFNTALADKASNDRLRSYPNWLTSRNLANEVSDETVAVLIDSVTSRYDIVVRFYKLKQQLLGLDELYEWDRYAPLASADRSYHWSEARQIILNAFADFSPRMAEVAEMFFKHSWIDAVVAPGKQGGAYSHPAVPSVHPYILMNYDGTVRDVSTLAHELGHGIHQWLARDRGLLQSNTPLTTAETASVFGEMLVFQSMLKAEDNPQVRLAMLMGKIENSFATVFRQIALNRFENAIHEVRRAEGELPSDRYNQIWLDTQRQMFGDSLTITDDYGYWWSYISHFIDVPGYVYAYAFGELLVLALYARYQEKPDGFADAYLTLLSKGGSDWPHELLKPFDIDLTEPGFWQRGLEILGDFVHQAEELAAQH